MAALTRHPRAMRSQVVIPPCLLVISSRESPKVKWIYEASCHRDPKVGLGRNEKARTFSRIWSEPTNAVTQNERRECSPCSGMRYAIIHLTAARNQVPPFLGNSLQHQHACQGTHSILAAAKADIDARAYLSSHRSIAEPQQLLCAEGALSPDTVS